MHKKMSPSQGCPKPEILILQFVARFLRFQRSQKFNPGQVTLVLFNVMQELLFGEEYRFLQVFSPGKHLITITKKKNIFSEIIFPLQGSKRSFIVVGND